MLCYMCIKLKPILKKVQNTSHKAKTGLDKQIKWVEEISYCKNEYQSFKGKHKLR